MTGGVSLIFQIYFAQVNAGIFQTSLRKKTMCIAWYSLLRLNKHSCLLSWFFAALPLFPFCFGLSSKTRSHTVSGSLFGAPPCSPAHLPGLVLSNVERDINNESWSRNHSGEYSSTAEKCPLSMFDIINFTVYILSAGFTLLDHIYSQLFRSFKRILLSCSLCFGGERPWPVYIEIIWLRELWSFWTGSVQQIQICTVTVISTSSAEEVHSSQNNLRIL